LDRGQFGFVSLSPRDARSHIEVTEGENNRLYHKNTSPSCCETARFEPWPPLYVSQQSADVTKIYRTQERVNFRRCLKVRQYRAKCRVSFLSVSKSRHLALCHIKFFNLCSQANNGGLRNKRYVFLEEGLYSIYNFQVATKMSLLFLLIFCGYLICEQLLGFLLSKNEKKIWAERPSPTENTIESKTVNITIKTQKICTFSPIVFMCFAI